MEYEEMTREQLINALIHWKYKYNSLKQSTKSTTRELQKSNQRLALEIIERKMAEEKSALFNRLYSVLGRVNEAIVRFREPELLYQQVCRIIVEFGAFPMAWIGLVDPVTLLVEPVGHWGVDNEYLNKITVSVEEIPEGYGPVGTAIRQGRYNICPDFKHDPRMYPWRDEAIKRGYRSCIALPLTVGEKHVGVLTVYSTQPFFFQDEDIKLLVSLTDNISFAVEFIEKEKRRQQMEKEMERVERLNLVGDMAAGIGHEIRNPMTTVRGFLQVLKKRKGCSQYKEHFNLMIRELDNANSIITQFISLAGGRALNKKVQNINTVIETVFPLIQANILQSNMQVNWKPGNIPDMPLDNKEIRQLVLNLIRNGVEAMSPGGTITIRTFMAENKVVLSVQDTGKGIAPGILEKVGTPFFTTKANGTGLGLAVCHSIAAKHNAIIDIDSDPNGTTVYVRFKLQGDSGKDS